MFVAVTDEDLARTATVVVEGTVAGIETIAGDSDTSTIYTYVTIDPSRILKGGIPNAPFVIREPGGFVEGRGEWLWGSPEFAVGERVVLFLKRGDDGVLHTLHMSLGKFVVESTSGGDTVTQDPGYGAVIYTPFQGGLRRAPAPAAQSLHGFVDKVEGVVANEPEEAWAPIDLVPEALWSNQAREYTANYTFLGAPGRLRWFEPDTGQTVFYKIDSTGDDKLGFASTRVAFNRALGAWSNVDGAGLLMADGGTLDPVRFFDGNDCPNGSRVMFDDPWNEIDDPTNCGGTLGIGGFCASGEQTTVNGAVFSRITAGRVMMGNGFLDCSYWNEANVAEVLTHEIGHTIGFGHSADNDATMRGSAHFDGRGINAPSNPLIRADDAAAMLFSYPVVGTPRPSFTPTRTVPPTQTQPPTFTPQAPATLTPTVTRTGTRTRTFTRTRTPTRTRTATRIRTATRTRTPTRTRTVGVGGPTATATQQSIGVPTSTPPPGVGTATRTATRTRTLTRTRTMTRTRTVTKTRTPTRTRTFTRTRTPTRTPVL